ncbi:MAG: GlsB/YeaQ/YmgE family stress response membrane protein [Anaerolineales bacterium]|nr:GlsB/YeaQ/YmgE family stress response membrane protein [Anaerolineales bacterium]
MSILSWIVVGLIAGWLAGAVMKGRGFGLIGNLIVGVIGGILGGFIAFYFFHVGDPMSGVNLTSVLIAFGGAVLLLAIVHPLVGRRVFRR